MKLFIKLCAFFRISYSFFLIHHQMILENSAIFQRGIIRAYLVVLIITIIYAWCLYQVSIAFIKVVPFVEDKRKKTKDVQSKVKQYLDGKKSCLEGTEQKALGGHDMEMICLSINRNAFEVPNRISCD